MASLPGSVVQFLSVLVVTIVVFVVLLLLSSCLVFKKNHEYDSVIAPLHPKSKVGASTSFCGYLSAAFGLSERDVLGAGGLEALLHIRRLEYRTRICFLWVIVGIPVSLVYASNFTGGSTEGGFDRITMLNANVVHKNDGVVRNGDVWWKNIACVVAGYLMSIIALPILDSFDEDADKLILEDAAKAPMNHYGVVITGLEEDKRDETKLKEIFQDALGNGSVAAVELVRDYSSKPEGVVDEEVEQSTTASMKSLVMGGPGGVRERWEAYKGALKSAKRADLAYEASSGEASLMNKVTKSPEQAKIEARETVEKKKAAIDAVEGKELDATGAAVVVLSKLSTSTAAATAPLGIQHAWTVTPAPEPRGILWEVLEKLPVDQAKIDAKASTGTKLKIGMYVFWSLILLGLVTAAQFILRVAASSLGGPVAVVVQIVSGFVPSLVASTMMSLASTIIRNINIKSLPDVWAEHVLQNQTGKDYVIFLIAIGFVVPLLGQSLIAGIADMGGKPLSIFVTMSRNVPAIAYYFAMLVLVKLGGYLNDMTRFIPWVTYKVMDKLFCKTDFEREALLEPKPSDFVQWLGWESFAFLVAAVYVPIAPYATLVSFIWLAGAYKSRILSLSVIEETNYAAHGYMWRLTVQQTVLILVIANVLQIGVLAFSGNFAHAVCLLPVLYLDSMYSKKFRIRYEARSVHGKAKGRLPLLEATYVDHMRKPDIANTLVAECRPNKMYQPPCALNPPLYAPLAEDEDIMDRQYRIKDWEERYDDPSKLPTLGPEPELAKEEAKQHNAIDMA